MIIQWYVIWKIDFYLLVAIKIRLFKQTKVVFGMNLFGVNWPFQGDPCIHIIYSAYICVISLFISLSLTLDWDIIYFLWMRQLVLFGDYNQSTSRSLSVCIRKDSEKWMGRFGTDEQSWWSIAITVSTRDFLSFAVQICVLL